MKKALDVDGALALVEGIEDEARKWQRMAPRTVARMGGVDALTARAEMTGIGPMLRFTTEEWQELTLEYGDRAGWFH